MGLKYSSKVAGLIMKALCPMAMTALLLNLTVAEECRRNCLIEQQPFTLEYFCQILSMALGSLGASLQGNLVTGRDWIKTEEKTEAMVSSKRTEKQILKYALQYIRGQSIINPFNS